MKKNNTIGGLIAIFLFLCICYVGYIIGKYVYDYNKKNHTNYNITDILTIYNLKGEETNVNILSFDTIKTLKDLCEFDTGICDKVVGQIKLSDKEYNLYIYYNFDNAIEESAYLKINDIKIGNYIKLNSFYVLNNKYLVVTEPNNSDSNYIIHFYNELGKEVKNLTGTYNSAEISLNDNKLYYYYCDSNDLDQNNAKALKYYNITNAVNEINTTEISKEYGKC